MGYTRATRFTCDAKGCSEEFTSWWIPHEMTLADAAEHGWVFKMGGTIAFCPAHTLAARTAPE